MLTWEFVLLVFSLWNFSSAFSKIEGNSDLFEAYFKVIFLVIKFWAYVESLLGLLIVGSHYGDWLLSWTRWIFRAGENVVTGILVCLKFALMFVTGGFFWLCACLSFNWVELWTGDTIINCENKVLSENVLFTRVIFFSFHLVFQCAQCCSIERSSSPERYAEYTSVINDSIY